MKYKKYFLLLFLVILLSITAVSANNNVSDEIWVSVDGVGSGNSIDDPTNFVDAMDNLKPELTINVLDGNYTSSKYSVFKDGVTIQAVNSGNVIFDGHETNSIFSVGGNRVTLSGLTFKNGYANSYGGAVYWFGLYGTLKDCRFVNNGAFSGGALFWQSDEGIVDNCIFEDNFAGGGGSIHWSGDNGKIVNTIFKNNLATSSDGGAIHWSSPNGIIENCSFISNSAPKYIGGAIYWSGFNGTFLNNEFINNYDVNGYQFYISNTGSFKNNTFNNKKAIFNVGTINSNLKIIILDNQTKSVGLNSQLEISAIIVDDMGNRVGGNNLTFLIENKAISCSANNDVEYLIFYKISNNKTIISAKYPYGTNLTIYNAVIMAYTIRASDLLMYYKNGSKYEVFSEFNESKVLFMVNGMSYEKSVVDKKASLNINLRPGIYNITAKYEDFQINNIIHVLPTIISTNLVKIFRNDSQFIVKILTKNGNPLPNSNVSFNINGVIYKRTTNSEGLAKLNINLYKGNYTITTMASDGCIISNNIEVLPILVENNNLVKFFKNSSKYTVKVLDKQGNPLKGVSVLFNINGIFYNRTTNSDGFASLNINLGPGNYIVTALYNGFYVSNSIKVLKTIESENLIISNDKKSPFKVRILDNQGNPLSNAKVIFNINGILQNEISDVNGYASWDINLKAGDYIITTFCNGLYVSNKISIKEN